MKTPVFWRNINIISVALLPISALYWLISTLIYKFTKTQKFKTKIICIGNTLAGGSGKTPVAIMLGKLLIKRGFKIAFACKNYKATISIPTKIHNHKSPQAIEESLLLSKTADTFVAADLVEAIGLADIQGYDFIITDDGLQNNKFYKDISFLVIDGEIGLGNGMLIPSGPMRETLDTAIKKVKAVLLIGNDKKNLKEKINKKPIMLTRSFNKIGSHKPHNKYIAFTGLAYPEKFFNSLESNNISIHEKINFPDHHLYSSEEIKALLQKSEKENCSLITTEKDIVKIPLQYRSKILYLELELSPSNECELLDLI